MDVIYTTPIALEVTPDWFKDFFEKVYKSTRASRIIFNHIEKITYESSSKKENRTFRYGAELVIDNASYKSVHSLLTNPEFSIFTLGRDIDNNMGPESISQNIKIISVSERVTIADIDEEKNYSTQRSFPAVKYDITTNHRLNPYTSDGRACIESNLRALYSSMENFTGGFKKTGTINKVRFEFHLPDISLSFLGNTTGISIHVKTNYDFSAVPKDIRDAKAKGILFDRLSRYCDIGDIDLSKVNVNVIIDTTGEGE